jgi:hypothetical protein
MYEGISNRSWARSKKKFWLNSILAAISFKIVSLGMYTAIPSLFPWFKSNMEVTFLAAVECR